MRHVVDMRAIVPVIESVKTILIGSRWVSEAAVAEVETPQARGKSAPIRIGSVQRTSHPRSVRDLEKKEDAPAPGEEATFTEKMAHRTASKENREKYKQRQQTTEPIFGILNLISAVGADGLGLSGEKSGIPLGGFSNCGAVASNQRQSLV